MINKKFEEAIKIIGEALNQNNIKWALIGSTNMAIQGINVSPRDLDILVQWSDLERVKSIFLDYNPSKINELKPFMEGQQAWEMKANILGIEVQFFSEKAGEYVKKFLANRITKIKLDSIEIPCFTLEDEAQTYEKTNRMHKADLINNYLKTKK